MRILCSCFSLEADNFPYTFINKLLKAFFIRSGSFVRLVILYKITHLNIIINMWVKIIITKIIEKKNQKLEVNFLSKVIINSQENIAFLRSRIVLVWSKFFKYRTAPPTTKISEKIYDQFRTYFIYLLIRQRKFSSNQADLSTWPKVQIRENWP